MWRELLVCHAGINSVVFYAPVLFSSLGMGQDSALLSSVITGAVFVAATIISILTVDTFGRKVQFFRAHIPPSLSTIAFACRDILGWRHFDAALCRHDMRPTSRQSNE